MQGVITDYPDDVLPDAVDEKMRQEVIIAAANPKDIDLKEKGINAGQALFGKAITAIAVAGTAYSLFKSGEKMVKQVESVGKFLKKIF